MRSSAPAATRQSRSTPHRTTVRRRRADVLGVCDTLTEAEQATTVLASRGIATARISVIMPPLARGRRATSADDEVVVLLHGQRHDTERAHEILADAAALAYDEAS
ncbi:hypothetical protein BH23ACT10_BH23ACT10_12610 [soil metagenome]